MNNRFILILAILIIGFGGIFWINKTKKSSTGSSNVQPTNHTRGTGSSGVVLTEYGDFECPACYSYEPLIIAVVEKYKGIITFQYRNFPLTQIHQNALASHRAAEAAAKQGKFWEMHDLLISRSHQQDSQGKTAKAEWTATTNPAPFFEQYAQSLGLDMVKFKADMNSSEVNDLINADREAGNKLGATGTPTFAINGEKIETPKNIEEFSKVIDEAIKAKSQQ